MLLCYNHPGTIAQSNVSVGDKIGFYYKGSFRTITVAEVHPTYIKGWDLKKFAFRSFHVANMRETTKIIINVT